VKPGQNLAEYSEEGYGSKRALWLMMVIMMIMNIQNSGIHFTEILNFTFLAEYLTICANV
jgi:hypothetical protein